jgi:histidine triad (HIT) family protein
MSKDVQQIEAELADCPFCDYAGPSKVLWDDGDVFIIEPIAPVTAGHVLVIPTAHVKDFVEHTFVASLCLQVAGEWVRNHNMGDCNLITSRGPAATQTVGHLHIHIVPRRIGDGLSLPWADGG